MKRPGGLVLVAVTLLLTVFALLETPAQARQQSLAGNYNCTGTNPDGLEYRGTTTITRISQDRYSLKWAIAAQNFTGTGTLAGNTLTVDWGDTSPVIYKVNHNGTLEGTWSNGRATEVLVPTSLEAPTATAQVQRETLTYTDGSRYEGEIRNGKRHGRGAYTYSDGDRYEGEWRDGNKHGRGTYTFSDGGRYVGEFRNDNLHGRGTRTWANGERYEGEYRNGKRTGRGTYAWPEGHRYEGQWRNGKKHGRGTYIWANGNRYEGAWRNEKRTGQGTFTWPNGNRYEGEWRDDKAHGRGAYTWADGGRYVGEFRHDKAHGRGTRTWPNGERYEGEWRGDEMHGQGTYTWANGNRYVGEFRNGKMHGRGTMTRADGSRYEGEWRDGKRVDRLAGERGRDRRSLSGSKAEEKALGLIMPMRMMIQSCLKTQGFDPGPADGVFGPRTRAAIRGWQAARGEGRATGYFTADGLGVLMAGCQVAERPENRQPEKENVNSAELFDLIEQSGNSIIRAKIMDLLDRGADPNVVDANGNTPMHYATIPHTNEPIVLRALIRRGGRCNAKNAIGETPLHFMAVVMTTPPFQDYPKLLIGCGADPNSQDNRGNTPLHLAFHELRSYSHPSTRYAHFNFAENQETVGRLLRYGSDPNITNADGETVLIVALRTWAMTSSIELLLAHGANPNDQDEHGTPALVLTNTFDDHYDKYVPQITSILLRAGADPNGRNAEGRTPLHLAAAKNRLPIVNELLAYRADPNRQEDNGETPLHTAAEHASLSIVEALLEGGADLCVTNAEGYIPWNIATTQAKRNALIDINFSDMTRQCAAEIEAQIPAGTPVPHNPPTMTRGIQRQRERQAETRSRDATGSGSGSKQHEKRTPGTGTPPKPQRTCYISYKDIVQPGSISGGDCVAYNSEYAGLWIVPCNSHTAKGLHATCPSY